MIKAFFNKNTKQHKVEETWPSESTDFIFEITSFFSQKYLPINPGAIQSNMAPRRKVSRHELSHNLVEVFNFKQ